MPDEATRAARAAASQAFLALDDEQRAAADAVRAADELGAQPGLSGAWARVATVGDRATEAYLAATAQFPLDGTGPLVGARAADERALREIEVARDAIRWFRGAYARTLDEAAFALAALPRAVQEAKEALVTARSAVQAADAAGTRSRRAAEQLAAAEQAATALDATGIRERRAAAARTVELARAAAGLAAEAPHTAAAVRSAFTSVATRRAAVETKIDRIGPALSALRREFSEPCSRDLAGAASRAREALAAAETAMDSARKLGAAGEWDDAAQAMAAARAALGRAEDQHSAVIDRLADLRGIRADPTVAAAEARFALRDAQRLVVDRHVVARFGAVLDAQAVRLQNAIGRLTGVHPDYWLYLTELRGVRARTQEVVSDVRAAR